MAGIYVHIPFCHAKCAYCDFFSTPRMDSAEIVAEGIIKEYLKRINELGDQEIRTIYLGGGTPSCLPDALLRMIVECLPTKDAEEITIEVNPEDVSARRAVFWRELGFNRVSMGVQSLVDDELRTVGRRHSAQEAIDAIERLRVAGFDNISCDLIYGLPGQTSDSWHYSLDRLLECRIEHLSAYSLSYEPGTRLSAMLSAGKIEPVSDDVVADMYCQLCDSAAAHGFDHYEISNFALPGRRSLHNSSYWNNTPYLGLGPGAHSMDCTGLRRAAPASVKQWLDRGAIPEAESDIDRINDIIITGLRTSRGLDLRLIRKQEHRESVLRQASVHIASGRLTKHEEFLIIPEQRWLVSDAIMRDLMLD